MTIHTDATSGPGAERHVRVIMAVGRSLRQEIVRIEHIRIGEDFFVPVDFERTDNDSCTGG